jgi:hypothetical protein
MILLPTTETASSVDGHGNSMNNHATYFEQPAQDYAWNHYSNQLQQSMHTHEPSIAEHSPSHSVQSPTESGDSQSAMSPPLTPLVGQEQYQDPGVSTFHNYLRAFHHFHPDATISSSNNESSITVQIDQGDVILVHTIHPNGWADGTLLRSGSRGWLPTNYCEPFDPPELRSLLNSLTNLWDLVRSSEHESLLAFSRHDYVRGMIAGVRLFLVSRCNFGLE